MFSFSEYLHRISKYSCCSTSFWDLFKSDNDFTISIVPCKYQTVNRILSSKKDLIFKTIGKKPFYCFYISFQCTRLSKIARSISLKCSGCLAIRNFATDNICRLKLFEEFIKQSTLSVTCNKMEPFGIWTIKTMGKRICCSYDDVRYKPLPKSSLSHILTN